MFDCVRFVRLRSNSPRGAALLLCSLAGSWPRRIIFASQQTPASGAETALGAQDGFDEHATAKARAFCGLWPAAKQRRLPAGSIAPSRDTCHVPTAQSLFDASTFPGMEQRREHVTGNAFFRHVTLSLYEGLIKEPPLP